ncbi:MAG: HAD hydrolase-like protein [Nitrososphaerota archaeon]|nr:HAD hydrolase-like protein [Nitrososphaerota archaeon]
MSRGVFVSDCEGPISKNDNAYELVVEFIPCGESFFGNVSRYDDVLADVFNRPGYTAGSTLRLILPFLKAFDVSDQQMENFSAGTISLIADTKVMLKRVGLVADSFIVSTSYGQYIRALCESVGFLFKNTYCTLVSLDSIVITTVERDLLRLLAREISQMSCITIPLGAKCLDDFSLKDQMLIKRLDEIFWSELPKLSVGKFFDTVVTIGGEQKAASILEIVGRLGVSFESVMYVGDSITDVEALQLVRERGGLAVSFNGNGYAVKSADVAVMSGSNLVLAVLADVFFRFGREEVFRLAELWSRDVLGSVGVDLGLLCEVFESNIEPKVQIVTSENIGKIVAESSEFRKRVRGVAIGRLG